MWGNSSSALGYATLFWGWSGGAVERLRISKIVSSVWGFLGGDFGEEGRREKEGRESGGREMRRTGSTNRWGGVGRSSMVYLGLDLTGWLAGWLAGWRARWDGMEWNGACLDGSDALFSILFSILFSVLFSFPPLPILPGLLYPGLRYEGTWLERSST